MYKHSLLALVTAVVCLPSVSAAAVCPHEWTRNLSLGSAGSDVRALQLYLAANGAPALPLTGYYGPMTARAVSTFQETYSAEILAPAGLSRGVGRVGPSTRAKLAALCAAAPATTVSVAPAPAEQATSSLGIALGKQPAATILPARALGVPFTTFVLTAGSADVTVSSITVRNAGFASAQVFEGVGIVDEDGEDVADERRFTSDQLAQFRTDLHIPAGASKTLTIEGGITDDLASYNGQMPALSVVAIEANASIAGVLPLRGTMHTLVANLEMASVLMYRGVYDPGADTARTINDTNMRFSGIRIEASEDAELASITWDQSGTAAPADLANVVTVVDGVSYPTTVDGRSYTTTFPNPIEIEGERSIEAYIQGDLLISGINRTVKFDIRGGDDIALIDPEFGFSFEPGIGGNTAQSGGSAFLTSDGTTDGDSLTPFYAGSTATIGGATFIHIGR
ncbi:hypothetical protein FJY94_00085 [Candidatus Kaiserbacteria bacterium]|nr:hypothetical protein [Candidatus Kaiserbacteria bacterium]